MGVNTLGEGGEALTTGWGERDVVATIDAPRPRRVDLTVATQVDARFLHSPFLGGAPRSRSDFGTGS